MVLIDFYSHFFRQSKSVHIDIPDGSEKTESGAFWAHKNGALQGAEQ